MEPDRSLDLDSLFKADTYDMPNAETRKGTRIYLTIACLGWREDLVQILTTWML